MDGTTIRDIANAAGVSGGLVRHHFGSKDDLRAACDSYALDQLMQIKEQAVLDGQLANASVHVRRPPHGAADLPLSGPLPGGRLAGGRGDVRRDGGTRARHGSRTHNPGQMADPRGYSAVLVAMQTGMLMMHGQLSRWLGADIFTAEGHLRLTEAMIDFFSQPLLSPELAEQARTTVRHLQAQQPAAGRPAR